jgi:putative transposase
LAGWLQQIYAISERRASRLVHISRKALPYQALRPARDAALVARLKPLGERRYPRYGYRLLHGLLRAEGLIQNRKCT